MRRHFIVGCSIVLLLAGTQHAMAAEGVSGSASTNVETLGPIEAIQDGSFEAGSPNPFWNQWSSTGIIPISTSGACGPRSGSWWVWYRGTTAASQHRVDQDVFLPAGATATLRFYLHRSNPGKRVSDRPAEPAAGRRQVTAVTVEIDSVPVQVVDADDPLYSNNYAPITVDVSSFATGTTRNVALIGDLGTFDFDGFCIDDVSLTAPDPACADPGGSCQNQFISPPDGAVDLPLQPTFQWQCVNDALFYDVWVDDGSGGFTVCQATGTSCTPQQPLSPATTYTTWVVANSTQVLCTTATQTFTTIGAPTANFTWTPTTPDVAQTVQFTDTSQDNPTSWLWDFGDGGSSSQQNPTHSYAAAGDYTVTLTVSNAAGSDNISQQISVVFSLAADFTWMPTTPEVSQIVQFTDTSAGQPTSWNWQFGDGGSSTQPNPSHSYAATGDYTVTLTVSNAAGSDNISQQISVVSSLAADFTWAPFSPEMDQPVFFTDTSAGQPTAWSWDFGDGHGSAQQNPIHTYTSAGPMTVSLTVSTDFGSDDASHVINVREALDVEGGPEQGVSSPDVDVDSQIGTAVDRDGNRVIVWQQPVNLAKTLDNGVTVHQAGEGVFGRYFNPEGEPQGDEFEVGEAAPNGTAEPSVDFDGGGGFVVGWQSGSEAGGGVFGRQFSPDLAPGSDAFQVSDLGGRAEAPQVATRAAGDFLVVWEQYNSKNLQGAAGIFGRTFGADSSAQGGAFRIDQGTPGEQVGNPSAASDASGNVVVVWEQGGSSKTLQGNTGVFGRFFGPSGDPSSEPAQIDSGEGMAVDPAAASSVLGRTIIVWAEDSGKQGGSDIFGRMFSEGGEQAGEQFQVNAQTEGDQTDPSVAINASGEFVVSWQSAVGTTEGIVARYFDPQGFPLGSQFEVFSEPLAAPRSPEVTLADDDTVSVVYTRRHSGPGGRGVYTRSFSVQPPAGECRQDATTNCLNDRRFQVQVAWRDFANNTGVGTAVRLTDDTGYFWFFDSANVELVVKVLDGTSINDYFWVFYGALSNVEYTITVSDTLTGNTVTYLNDSDTFGSAGDTEALPADTKAMERPVHTFREMGRESTDSFLFSSGAIPVESTKAIVADCTPDDRTLCLNGDRFMLRSSWQDFQGNQGTGRAVPLTSDTGYFWFFDPANVELITKVLDGTGINGHYWVFYGALSNVEYSLSVTDTETGAAKTYENPSGTFASVGDTSAFQEP